MKNKILLITYYWPPSGGAGVQRWLKMSKYLTELGWDITVYSPENPETPALDYSLVKEVHPNIKEFKKKIWEPYTLYSYLSGNKKSNHANYLGSNKKGVIQKTSEWIRANIFIPDPRSFWVKPSVRYLSRLQKDTPFDIVISTGPPHSMHLIALGLKKQFRNIKWLADFRDPWTFIDFFHLLPLSKRSENKHLTLEKEVIEHANTLVTVSPSWAENFKELHGKKFNVIFNGYDPEDFNHLNKSIKNDFFTLCHIGSLNSDRDPESLWDYLEEKCNSDLRFSQKLEIKLIGKVNPKTLNRIESSRILRSKLSHIDYLPHNEALVEMEKSSVLLLLINKSPNAIGIIPGKIFEYLASKKTTLCISPIENDCTRLLKEFNQVHIANNENIKDAIDALFDDFMNNKEVPYSTKHEKYSRKNQALEIDHLLRELN